MKIFLGFDWLKETGYRAGDVRHMLRTMTIFAALLSFLVGCASEPRKNWEEFYKDRPRINIKKAPSTDVFYPKEQRLARRTGYATLSYSISMSGRAENIRLAEPSKMEFVPSAGTYLRLLSFDLPKSWNETRSATEQFQIQFVFNMECMPPIKLGKI